jgi:hypothetical protein
LTYDFEIPTGLVGKCAEVDALAPSELGHRVKKMIDGHNDQDRWNMLIEIEVKEQETINKMVLQWKEGA